MAGAKADKMEKGSGLVNRIRRKTKKITESIKKAKEKYSFDKRVKESTKHVLKELKEVGILSSKDRSYLKGISEIEGRNVEHFHARVLKYPLNKAIKSTLKLISEGYYKVKGTHQYKSKIITPIDAFEEMLSRINGAYKEKKNSINSNDYLKAARRIIADIIAITYHPVLSPKPYEEMFSGIYVSYEVIKRMKGRGLLLSDQTINTLEEIYEFAIKDLRKEPFQEGMRPGKRLEWLEPIVENISSFQNIPKLTEELDKTFEVMKELDVSYSKAKDIFLKLISSVRGAKDPDTAMVIGLSGMREFIQRHKDILDKVDSKEFREHIGYWIGSISKEIVNLQDPRFIDKASSLLNYIIKTAVHTSKSDSGMLLPREYSTEKYEFDKYCIDEGVFQEFNVFIRNLVRDYEQYGIKSRYPFWGILETYKSIIENYRNKEDIGHLMKKINDVLPLGKNKLLIGLQLLNHYIKTYNPSPRSIVIKEYGEIMRDFVNVVAEEAKNEKITHLALDTFKAITENKSIWSWNNKEGRNYLKHNIKEIAKDIISIYNAMEEIQQKNEYIDMDAYIKPINEIYATTELFSSPENITRVTKEIINIVKNDLGVEKVKELQKAPEIEYK